MMTFQSRCFRPKAVGLSAGCDAILAGVDNGYVTYKAGPARHFVDGRLVSIEEYKAELARRNHRSDDDGVQSNI